MFLGLCQTFLPRVHWGGLHDKPKESRCGRLHRLKVFPPSAYSSSVYQKSMMDTIIHFWVLSFLTFQFRFSNSLLEVPVGEDIRDLKIRWQWQQQECQKSNRFNNQNNNFAFASHFFCTQLQCENALFHVLQRKYTSDNKISPLFPNLDMVLRNSALGGFTYIWQS